MPKTFINFSPTPAHARALDQEVALRLRNRRRQLALTQQDVAASMNLSYQQIQKYETGTNRISAGRLFLMAKALGVKPTYFFDALDLILDDDQVAGQILNHEKALDRRIRHTLNELVLALTE